MALSTQSGNEPDAGLVTRLSRRRLIGRLLAGYSLAAAATVLAANAQVAPEEGEATNGCSQEDLPAVILRIKSATASEPVILTVEIAGQAQGSELPATVPLVPLRRDPSIPMKRFARARLERTGQPAVWLAGKIELESFVDQKEVTGHYDFQAPDGQVFRSSFRASWIAGVATCG